VSNRFTILLLFVAAAFAAAQVGVVQARRSEASALRRRLGDVQARCASSELSLKRELDAARVRLDWLQALVDRKGLEAERLRRDLAGARQALELVKLSARGAQSQIDLVHETLDGAPEALRVELVASADLAQLVARATNASGSPVQVLEVSGRLWLGERAEDSGYSAGGSQLAGGDVLDLFEYNLFAGEPERVLAGEETLRAALCLAWEPADGSGEWIHSYWFEYQVETGGLALLRRDGAPGESGARCDLEAATTPW
jgi:hypothetical protein